MVFGDRKSLNAKPQACDGTPAGQAAPPEALRAVRPKIMARALLASVMLPLLLAACGQKELPVRGEIALNSMFDAEFELTDHFGDAASDERFEGKPMFIYFGFTTCPDVCPAALGHMTAALDRLGKEADGLHPLFITVDPERDNAERLKNHLAYDERILGLTGSAEALEAARDAMNVYAAKVPLPDSAMEYTVDHQRLFYLTDADGVPVVAMPDSTAPEDLARILKRYL